MFSQRPNRVQIHITHIQLIEPSEKRIEQKRIGFQVRFTVVGIEHFLVDVEGAVEKEFAAAAKADDGVVEWDGGVIDSAGDDFLD